MKHDTVNEIEAMILEKPHTCGVWCLHLVVTSLAKNIIVFKMLSQFERTFSTCMTYLRSVRNTLNVPSASNS